MITFKDFEPEVKKVMSRALSGLHSGSDATGQQAADDKALMDNFTRLMKPSASSWPLPEVPLPTDVVPTETRCQRIAKMADFWTQYRDRSRSGGPSPKEGPPRQRSRGFMAKAQAKNWQKTEAGSPWRQGRGQEKPSSGSKRKSLSPDSSSMRNRDIVVPPHDEGEDALVLGALANGATGAGVEDSLETWLDDNWFCKAPVFVVVRPEPYLQQKREIGSLLAARAGYPRLMRQLKTAFRKTIAQTML
eukprot:gene19944-26652_t